MMKAEKSKNQVPKANSESKTKRRKIPYSFTSLSSEKANELLYEIEVHQIELEVQNRELQNAQQRLEEIRDLYTNLFDFAPLGYLLINEKGVVTNINLTGCSLMGIDRTQIKGKPFSSFVSKHDSKTLYSKLKETFTTGAVIPFDLTIKHPSKGLINVLMHGTLNQKKISGETICHLSIQDVTELRKAEILKGQFNDLRREKEQVQQYLDLAPVVFLLIDTDQKVRLINQKGCEVLGYKREEIEGKTWFKNFVRPLYVNGGDYTYYNIENKKLLWAPFFECTVVCKNGEDKLMSWSNTTLFDSSGEIMGTLSAGEDITVRKKLEVDKQEYTDELEEIVKERTLRLTEALKTERQINEMKSAFISIASHELRTPLTIVLSSTILIEKYLEAGSYDKQQKHIDRIKESIVHFTTILDDFLSLDKLERGIIIASKHHFSLKKLIQKSISEMEPILKPNQKILARFRGEMDIVLDQKIMHNVLINLLSNAIKYSEEDIELDAIVNNDFLTISIKDKGIGISKTEQKYLFTRFFRGKNTKNIPGTGLGLSIVKRYMELLGGTIQFSSKPNIGSTFTALIPIEE
jgi:PAS domain S-box-containing protein